MVECQRCGRVDQTLRATSFIYTFSIIVMTFRRGSGGVFCGSCRKKEGLKYSAVSAIFGWWGIPWGPVYTLQALGRNSAGGYQDKELNAELLQAVASNLIDGDDKTGAIAALEESLRLDDNGTVRQALWSLQGEAVATAAPAIASNPAIARVLSGPTLRPGQLVKSANGFAPLYSDPAEAGDPVAHLGIESAVVMRAQDGWVELQMPGGRSGWTRTSAVTAD